MIGSKTQERPEISFDLWPEGAYIRSDVDDVAKVLSQFGKASGRTSSNMRGMEIQATIVFTGLAVAQGFFAEFGKEIYRKLKAQLKEALTAPIRRARHDGTYRRSEGGSIWVHCSHGPIKIVAACIYRNSRSIDVFLSKLGPSLGRIHDRIRDGKIPSKDEVRVHVSLVDHKGPSAFGWKFTNGKLKSEVWGLKNIPLRFSKGSRPTRRKRSLPKSRVDDRETRPKP